MVHKTFYLSNEIRTCFTAVIPKKKNPQKKNTHIKSCRVHILSGSVSFRKVPIPTRVLVFCGAEQNQNFFLQTVI